MRMRVALTIFALGLGTIEAINAQPADLLTITPAVLTLPPTGVGSTSFAIYPGLTIYNPGTSPVTITSITFRGRNASDFSVDPNACPLPYTLPPGASCQPNVSFSPTAVGLRLATLVVNDVGGAAQTVALAGQGLAPTQAVSFSVPQVVFSETPVGIPLANAPTAFVQIISAGTAPLTIQSISIAGPDAADFQIVSNFCNPGVLPSGTSCYLYIAFDPTAAGARSAGLQLSDNAPGGVQSLPLIGVGGAPENLLQFFPMAVAFAPTGSGSPESSELTVQNIGSKPVTLNGVVLDGPNASDFSLIYNGCEPIPYTLNVFAQCNASLLFNPSAAGARFANLHFIDSATGSPQAVPLQGFGLPSTISLSFSPSPLDAGITTVGVPVFPFLYLSNTGGGPAQVSLQVTGPAAGDFFLFSNSCPFPVTSTTPCFIPITFTPSAAGVRAAMLTATDSISGSSTSLLMVGAGEPLNAALFTSPPIFPNEGVGTTSPPTSLYVNNYGASSVTITGVTEAGGASSDFTILQNNCPTGTILQPFNSCSLQITFTPSAVGPRLAAVNISYSGEPSALVVPLVGLGLSSARQIGFSATSLDLGAQPLGSPNSANVNIDNTGGAAVTLNSVSIAGTDAADFAVTGNQCPQPPETLAVGANCLVTVQFTPSALGPRVAHLQVADNATGSPQNLPMVGFGNNAAPMLQISPGNLSFNPQPLGSTSQQNISLDNFAGGPPVSITSIQVAGANAADFALINTCPPLLSSATYCYLYINFTPSVSGLRTAYIRIQDNALGSPQIIPLVGMGLQSVPTLSISINPIPLAFQPQAIGYTAPNTLNLQNTGTENVLLTGFHVGGRNKADFGILSNTCPFSPAPMPPGMFCQITIGFTPAATGLRVAAFQLSDNVPGSPQSVGIVGEGVPAVKTLQVTPSTVTFIPTPVGTTDYDGGVVNIYNSGTVPVTFASFIISGANAGDFTIANNFCASFGAPVLNPGMSCQIYLNFTPSAIGTRTGALNIGSDAAGSPAVVQLTGTGE